MRCVKPGGACNGSIALETAVILPLFLLLAVIILQFSFAMHALLLLRHAAENAAQETALLITLIEASGLEGSLERVLAGQSDETQVMAKLLAMTSRLGYEVFFENRMGYWMAESNTSQRTKKGLHAIHARIENALSEESLYVCVTYEMARLTGNDTGSFEVYIPVIPYENHQQSVGSANDPLWDLDNFTRGRTLRQRNGGNLPIGYPVIASYRDGLVTSIRSLDFTAPSWRQKDAIFQSLRVEIDALSAFEGTAAPWGRDQIDIHPGMIHTKVFLVIVPENTRLEDVDEQLTRAATYAQSKGVRLSVLSQGISTRYEP